MKRFVTGLFAIVMAASLLAGCGSKPAESSAVPEDSSAPASSAAPESAPAESSAEPTAAEKFVVGLDDSFPPMGFRDENNEIVGFDIDLAKEVSKRMGVEVVLQPIDWASKELELSSGNIDCIWNAFTVTPDREESMTMSRPYLKNHQVICVKPDSGIAAKADLEGKSVALQTDSSAEIALEGDEIKDKVKEVVPFPENVSALNDMKAGSVDAVILDEVVANYYAAKDPENFKVLDESLSEEEYAIGFKKGNTALADKVQAALDEMAADGTIAEISTKWFGKDIYLK